MLHGSGLRTLANTTAASSTKPFTHKPYGIANSASRLLPAGTVCISRTASAGLCRCHGARDGNQPRLCALRFRRLRSVPNCCASFPHRPRDVRRFGNGSVHKTIYFTEWLSVHVPLPPLAEQTRIVAEVERRLSVVEELEAVVSANLQRATRLRQSILQKAFTGAL